MTDFYNTPTNNFDREPTRGAFSLHDLLHTITLNWYWFVISIFISLAGALFYLAQTPKTYRRTTTILVKDFNKGGSSELTTFSDLAGLQNSRNIENELVMLRSRRLMSRVVQQLDLNITYQKPRTLLDRDLYGNSPIKIDFPKSSDNQHLSLTITPQKENCVLSNFTSDQLSEEIFSTQIKANYGDTLQTPVGAIVAHKLRELQPNELGKPIVVTHSSLSDAIDTYRNRIKCAVPQRQGSVAEISIEDIVPRRAEDILNTLIAIYNDDAIEDKRRISKATSDFIAARLEVIGRELGDVDRNIQHIKQTNNLTNFVTDAERNSAESSRFKAEGLSVESRIRMATFIRDYLSDQKNADNPIPATIDETNNVIATQIAEYNRAIIKHKKLLENSSAYNPIVQEIETTLGEIRHAIIASLNARIATLELQRNLLQNEERQTNRRIAALPARERALLTIARLQKIKEELFLYLLNKQEESQLGYAIAESNARTIDSAYGNNTPIAPRPAVILGIAIIAGIAIPFALLLLIEILNTSVRNRKDIEEYISAPFLGEIPRCAHSTLIHETGRDPLSEAFRILRSNMAFLNVSPEKPIRTILFTSSKPHAGKTFITKNLAIALSATGKRVIIVDLDLRRHTFSSQQGYGKSPRGVTAYITRNNTNIDTLIHTTSLHQNIDAIYAGIQPPNPAEILLSDRLDQLINELRNRYDYVFMDCTPAISVADAQICDRLADLCIYVIREGDLDREQLPDIERLHREKRFHNLCIVLNGTNTQRHGYGYGYNLKEEECDILSYRQRIINWLYWLVRNRKVHA